MPNFKSLSFSVKAVEGGGLVGGVTTVQTSADAAKRPWKPIPETAFMSHLADTARVTIFSGFEQFYLFDGFHNNLPTRCTTLA